MFRTLSSLRLRVALAVALVIAMPWLVARVGGSHLVVHDTEAHGPDRGVAVESKQMYPQRVAHEHANPPGPAPGL